MHGRVHEHARERRRPVASVSASPSAPALSIATTPGIRQTFSLSPPCPVTVAIIADVHHGTARDIDRTIPPDQHSLCNQAHEDRHDTVSRATSSPTPLVTRSATSPSATVTSPCPSMKLSKEHSPARFLHTILFLSSHRSSSSNPSSQFHPPRPNG
jgi:hypothetical protein